MVRTANKSSAATAAPVVVEKDSKKESKKDSKKVVVPPAGEAPVVTAPVDETDVHSVLSAKLSDFSTKIQQLSGVIAMLKTEYRVLEKSINRELKNAQKASSKKRRSSGNRKPSGFVKPTPISDELAVFLGKDKGSLLARTDVSKEINKYIREHKLQDAGNGRKINPDAKLAKLLKLGKEDELTYFNLQKYMKNHFLKVVVA
jgi:chromatin remodeling complex protein RSC6